MVTPTTRESRQERQRLTGSRKSIFCSAAETGEPTRGQRYTTGVQSTRSRYRAGDTGDGEKRGEKGAARGVVERQKGQGASMWVSELGVIIEVEYCTKSRIGSAIWDARGQKRKIVTKSTKTKANCPTQQKMHENGRRKVKSSKLISEFL